MFANIETLAVIDRNQLQEAFPDTSFPPDLTSDTLSDFGYVVLEFDPTPDVGLGEQVVAGELRRDGDRVIRGWAIVPPTQAELSSIFERAVQDKLDGAARDRGYDSLATAISYADEPAVPRFQADGQAFRRWRSLVWDYAHAELKAVLANQKPQPELDAFIASLPPLELPS